MLNIYDQLPSENICIRSIKLIQGFGIRIRPLVRTPVHPDILKPIYNLHILNIVYKRFVRVGTPSYVLL